MEVFHEPVTYSEAESKCRSLGGILAAPSTPVLQQEMLRLINQLGGPLGYGYWIGLKAPETGVKNFVWSTGEALDGWVAWGPDQPNNWKGKNQDCVVMKMREGERDKDGWNDNRCEEQRNYVCQLSDLKGWWKSLNIFLNCQLMRTSNQK